MAAAWEWVNRNWRVLVVMGMVVFWAGRLDMRVTVLEHRMDRIEMKVDQIDAKLDQVLLILASVGRFTPGRFNPSAAAPPIDARRI